VITGPVVVLKSSSRKFVLAQLSLGLIASNGVFTDGTVADFWRSPSHKQCWFVIMPNRRQFQQSEATNPERSLGGAYIDLYVCARSSSRPDCARDAGLRNHRAWADGRAS
jgi:hypothetical protein